jgi:hypothetical protein
MNHVADRPASSSGKPKARGGGKGLPYRYLCHLHQANKKVTYTPGVGGSEGILPVFRSFFIKWQFLGPVAKNCEHLAPSCLSICLHRTRWAPQGTDFHEI